MFKRNLKTEPQPLRIEVQVKKVVWDSEGLKVEVEVGYHGNTAITYEESSKFDEILGRNVHELITTKNQGSSELLQLKPGEKKVVVNFEGKRAE